MLQKEIIKNESTPRALSLLPVSPPKTNSLLLADVKPCKSLAVGRGPVAMFVRSDHVLFEGSSLKRSFR